MTDTGEYIVERRKIKHARINVNEQQRVKLIVPNEFTEEDISALLNHKHQWIEKNKRYFANTKPETIALKPDEILFMGKPIQSEFAASSKSELEKWYRKQAKNFITKRAQELSKQHKIRYNKIFIRNSTTKWGNCSPQKNLSFYWKLIKSPEYVIDYIILHELCHIVILKHNQNFWLKLSTLCSNYQKAVDWLNKYGKGL